MPYIPFGMCDIPMVVLTRDPAGAERAEREAEAARIERRADAAALAAKDTGLQLKIQACGVRCCDFSTVRAGTGDFNHCLGRGAFGAVYKGKLDGKAVAIKVFSGPNADQDWLTEMRVMAEITHINLMSIIGATADYTRRCIVLPLADGGDLGNAIGGGLRDGGLLRVLAGAARGLAYMLHELPTPILHLDIKPGNILVSDGRGLVADFGLAVLADKIAHRDARRSDRPGARLTKDSKMTLRTRGTPGYWDPELELSSDGQGLASLRSDVYSLGVVLAETIDHAFTRHAGFTKPVLMTPPRDPEAAVEAVQRAHHRGLMHEQSRFLQLAKSCTEELHDGRPWMDEVTYELQSITESAASASGGSGGSSGGGGACLSSSSSGRHSSRSTARISSGRHSSLASWHS
eukprot:SAG11_NODE_1830_length_4192_cov_7.908403_1_plen_404_part_00